MVAGGKSVLDACRRVRVSRATFYRWAARRPDVADMYQEGVIITVFKDAVEKLQLQLPVQSGKRYSLRRQKLIQ